jgi:hypothetical protein
MRSVTSFLVHLFPPLAKVRPAETSRVAERGLGVEARVCARRG